MGEPPHESDVAHELGDDEGEDPEPILKYQRLGASVTEILSSDVAICLAVHSRFLALGTKSGGVHVLDLNGNEIRRFTPHSARINCVSIDSTGEFVGSCSQDGTVVISSLYGADASTHWYPKPVAAISFDPDYATKRVFATGGMAGQLVVNSRGWFGSKDVVVHSGEGPITVLACAGPTLAWANDLGVKVYDALQSKRVSFVERPASAPVGSRFSCQLRWESNSELLIGWYDTIKIGRVRTRDAASLAAGGVGAAAARAGGVGSKYMEIVALIQTDFIVCGLCGVRLRPDSSSVHPADLLVLAYYESGGDGGTEGGGANGGAEMAELRLLTRQNDEIFSDALSLAGCGRRFELVPSSYRPPTRPRAARASAPCPQPL